MVTFASHQVPVYGSLLGSEIRSFLRVCKYSPAAIADVLDFVGVHGTIADCPCIDPEDADAIMGLLVRYTGHVESDPAEWPSWTDEVRWTTNEPEIEPLTPFEAYRPFEPDLADRLEWAILRDAEERLSGTLATIAGGSPEAPAPARTNRRKSQPNVTDEDVIIATGCCG